MSKKKHKQHRWVKLPRDSKINQQIVNELEELLTIADPHTMVKSLNHVFYMYLYYAPHYNHADFKHTSEDFYIIQDFLLNVNREMNGKI